MTLKIIILCKHQTSNIKHQTSNIKYQTSIVYALLLILFSGFTFKSKAQSSCCQITVINEVDCMLSLELLCSYSALSCSQCVVSYNPAPLYYLFGGTCNGNKINIQVGNIGYPSTTTITVPVTNCPCVPTEFGLSGYNFTLTGNTWFDDNHTQDHLGAIGGCCLGGIDVEWDPVNCIIHIRPAC